MQKILIVQSNLQKYKKKKVRQHGGRELHKKRGRLGAWFYRISCIVINKQRFFLPRPFSAFPLCNGPRITCNQLVHEYNRVKCPTTNTKAKKKRVRGGGQRRSVMCLFTIPFRLRQIMKFPTNTHTSSTQCWLLPESPDPSNSSNSLKSWPPLHKIFSSLCFWFTYFPPFHGYVCSTTPQETSKRTYFRNWIRTHVYLWPHF